MARKKKEQTMTKEELLNAVREKLKDAELYWYPFAHYSGIGNDADWTAKYDFFRRIGAIEHEGFDNWCKFLRSGVWDSIFMRGASIHCRRPKAVHLDERGRLHNPRGPAVDWADNFTVWFVHGVAVERRWVEQPETITYQEVIKQENVEVRRTMVDLMGLGRFVEQAKAKVLDQDRDSSNMPRRLLEVPAGNNDENIVLVEVQCPSTGKLAHLRVPPTMRKCTDAVAWSFGMDTPEYAPSLEA